MAQLSAKVVLTYSLLSCGVRASLSFGTNMFAVSTKKFGRDQTPHEVVSMEVLHVYNRDDLSVK